MKLIRSIGYALNGLWVAVRDQNNLRIHLLVSLMVIGVGLYFSITSTEWIILLMMICIVISLELMNTAIENLTDLVTKEQSPLAGKVKDIAASAVLFASLISVIIGIIIFVKYFFLTSNI